MKNNEKYKTFDERIVAFNKFCQAHKGCFNCPAYDENYGSQYCEYKWLELEQSEIDKNIIYKIMKRLETDLESVTKIREHTKFGTSGYWILTGSKNKLQALLNYVINLKEGEEKNDL